jgi:hypothetical protein
LCRKKAQRKNVEDNALLPTLFLAVFMLPDHHIDYGNILIKMFAIYCRLKVNHSSKESMTLAHSPIILCLVPTRLILLNSRLENCGICSCSISYGVFDISRSHFGRMFAAFQNLVLWIALYNLAIIIPYVLVISTGARKTRSCEKTQADTDSRTKDASV